MQRTLILAALLLTALPAVAERVAIPGTTVSMDVPTGFAAMPANIVASKYGRGGQPPKAVYTTPAPDYEANVAFSLRDVKVPEGGLTQVQPLLEKSVAAVPGLKWIKRGMVKSAGRDWIDLEFWVDGKAAPIYNHMRVTTEAGGLLLVTANASTGAYEKYKLALNAAMNSLK